MRGKQAEAERRAGSGAQPGTQPGFGLKFSLGSDLWSAPQPRSFHPFPRSPCPWLRSRGSRASFLYFVGGVLESWTYRPRKSSSGPGAHHWPGFPSQSIVIYPPVPLWDFSLESSLPRTFWVSCLPKTCSSTHPYSGRPDVSVTTPGQPNPIWIAEPPLPMGFGLRRQETAAASA